MRRVASTAVTLAHEDGSDAVELAMLADQLGLPAVGGDEERAPTT
jgi:hypothetical protein